MAFEAAHARVSVTGVTVDRLATRDVTALLARADLKRCYVASVAAGEPETPGTMSVTLDADDLRVAHAHATGGARSPSLRRCIESLFVGGRTPSADTGAGSARIDLEFVP